jgi:hypothetical protein
MPCKGQYTASILTLVNERMQQLPSIFFVCGKYLKTLFRKKRLSNGGIKIKLRLKAREHLSNG